MQNLVLAMNTDVLTSTLLSERDIGQFDSQITGLQNAERRRRLQDAGMRSSNVAADVQNEVNEEDEEDCQREDDEQLQQAKCHCGKGSSQPNNIMMDKIAEYKKSMKDVKKRVKEWRRDETVTSKNPLDYCTQFVLSFHPLKLMNYSKRLVCWDITCPGHLCKYHISIIMLFPSYVL